jgi:hypothetical protein
MESKSEVPAWLAGFSFYVPSQSRESSTTGGSRPSGLSLADGNGIEEEMVNKSTGSVFSELISDGKQDSNSNFVPSIAEMLEESASKMSDVVPSKQKQQKHRMTSDTGSTTQSHINNRTDRKMCLIDNNGGTFHRTSAEESSNGQLGLIGSDIDMTTEGSNLDFNQTPSFKKLNKSPVKRRMVTRWRSYHHKMADKDTILDDLENNKEFQGNTEKSGEIVLFVFHSRHNRIP